MFLILLYLQQSITAGMLHHRPENPVEFLQECLDKLSKTKGSPRWDTFINFNPSEKSMRPASRPGKSIVSQILFAEQYLNFDPN